MSKQPEGKLSTRIMKEWRKRGAWCYKVHGNEYQMSGVPDISGVFAGRSVWCETKQTGNKPSRIQWYRIKQIRKAGGLVVIAYSVTEALALLDHIEEGSHLETDCTCIYSDTRVPGALGG